MICDEINFAVVFTVDESSKVVGIVDVVNSIWLLVAIKVVVISDVVSSIIDVILQLVLHQNCAFFLVKLNS
jgi:hypothetical protein